MKASFVFLIFTCFLSPSALALPNCINLSLNKGDSIKPEHLPANISDVELMSRLVYAETMAAHCPAQKNALAEGISQVIWNRKLSFEKNGSQEAIKRVVFGRSQFASSLHVYHHDNTHSEWKSFLCPQDEALWKVITSLVEKLKSEGIKPQLQRATHYYMNKHFKTVRPPSWAKPGSELANLGEGCLSIYGLDQGFLKAPLPAPLPEQTVQ